MTEREMSTSHRDQLRAATDRLSALGRRLTDAQWDAPSLCTGWRVRDVYGHLAMGCSYPLARVAASVIGHRGSVDRASFDASVELGSACGRDELLERYDRARRAPKGLARVLPPAILFGDSAIHELDVRRALGLDEPADQFPDAVKVALLGLSTRISTSLVPARHRCDGLSLVATDVEWHRPVAAGPHVEGPAEDLVLAIAGRPAGLAALTGDGVGVLARRIGAVPPGPA